MYFNNDIFCKPILIEYNIVTNVYKYKVFNKINNDYEITECIKNKKKRKSCLVAISKIKKSKYISTKTLLRLKKNGYILDKNFIVILDLFKQKLNRKIQTYYNNRYLEKSDNRKKENVKNKIRYYKSLNRENPDKIKEEANLYNIICN